MITPITRDEILAQRDRINLAEALPEPYYRKGHLPGAVLLPHTEVDARAGAALPDRDSTIVVYCANLECRNSDLAAERLMALGYRDVRVYPGGKADWVAAGLPLER